MYRKIGDFRKMDIQVILNDQELIYEGIVDDAPIDIKELHYTKVELGKVTKIYVYKD